MYRINKYNLYVQMSVVNLYTNTVITQYKYAQYFFVHSQERLNSETFKKTTLEEG